MTNIDALAAREFPQRADLLYLNHAAVAPWPQRSADAVAQFAQQCVRDGATHYPEWLETEAALRRRCAALVNAADAEDIALLKNTSEALSVVAQGFPWREGDNVVISDEEFPSNRIAWQALARREVETREISLRHAQGPESALLQAADGRTRMIAISSVEYASGLRIDLAKLGADCRARGIALCVDAIQGLGAVPHDVRGMHIDFLMADGHKWLLGPEGLAVFYCSPQWRERLTLYQYGWHMVEHHFDFDRRDWTPAASARRFECGSPNMLGIVALNASLELLLEVGMENIERRILANSERLFDAIGAEPRLELLTDTTPGRYAGIVSFRPRRGDTEALFHYLREHNVVCAQRGGGVRFSPHFYTPAATLDGALSIVRDWLD